MAELGILLSSSERQLQRQVLKLCHDARRLDGRQPLQWRPLTIRTATLPSCRGSAHVRTDGGIDLSAAVRIELAEPRDGEPDSGFFQFSVTLPSRGQDERKLNDASSLALAEMLQDAWNCAYPREELCIAPKHFCWRIAVDIVVSECDASVADYASIAALAAAAQCRLPVYRVIEEERAEEVDEPQRELDVTLEVDSKLATRALRVDALPLLVSVYAVDAPCSYLLDALREEAAVAQSRVLVASTPDGCVERVLTATTQPDEKVSFDADALPTFIEIGVRIGALLHAQILDAVDGGDLQE